MFLTKELELQISVGLAANRWLYEKVNRIILPYHPNVIESIFCKKAFHLDNQHLRH